MNLLQILSVPLNVKQQLELPSLDEVQIKALDAEVIASSSKGFESILDIARSEYES